MQSLEHLVISGLCSSGDASTYRRELAELVSKKIDKNRSYRLGEFFSALSDPTRIKILELLEIKKRMCACELVVALGLSQPALSYHMNTLVRAGLLNIEKTGRWVFYSVMNPKLVYTLMKLADELYGRS